MRNVVVEKEMTNAFIQFEFSILGNEDASKETLIKMCLFHASLIDMRELAAKCKVTENIRVWFDAIMAPMFFVENVNCTIKEIAHGSELRTFFATLKPEYIAAHVNFR